MFPDDPFEEHTLTAADVGTVAVEDLTKPAPAGDNPFGAPPAAGADDDLFSVDVPVDSGYRVKAGKQPLKLISLTKGTSQAKNPMWIWEFVILIGPDAGKQLKMWTALTAAAMWKLREVMKAFKLPGAEGGAQAKFKRSEIIGKYVMADVVDDSFEGRPNSKIDKVFPVDDADVVRIEAAAKAALNKNVSPF